jgi:hypothetical protein
MNIKIRLAISLAVALISAVVIYLLNIISNITIPVIALFLATLAITSLFNVKSEGGTKKYLFITGIVMITNIYLQRNSEHSLIEVLALAYVSASIVALIIRFFTLLNEKLFNKAAS